MTGTDIQAWEYVPVGPFLGKSFGKKMKFVTPIFKIHLANLKVRIHTLCLPAVSLRIAHVLCLQVIL